MSCTPEWRWQRSGKGNYTTLAATDGTHLQGANCIPLDKSAAAMSCQHAMGWPSS